MHRDLTGADLHISKLHAATHLPTGTDPLPLIPGPQGLQGEAGPMGDTGLTGSTGAAGADSTVAGPQGDTGIQGITGNTGPTGAAGQNGAVGADSTVAGPTGDTGVQGIQGIQGSAGAKGDTGDTGAAGTTTWAGITDKPSTFAPSTHGHVKADVSDFPASMPASDVSVWAKAGTKPAYASSEITNISAAGQALIDDADAATQRVTLGLPRIEAGSSANGASNGGPASSGTIYFATAYSGAPTVIVSAQGLSDVRYVLVDSYTNRFTWAKYGTPGNYDNICWIAAGN